MPSVLKQIRKSMRRMVLGRADVPQQFPLGMRDPQSEVSVWLEGSGVHQNVTFNHVMACAAPFTVALGWEGLPDVDRAAPLALYFRERVGEERLLGVIGLRWSGSLAMPSGEIRLFESRGCHNYCLPRGRIWVCSLFYGYLRWRQPPEVRVTWRDAESNVVFFLCPRPVALASVGSRKVGNIFPLNLMGPIGRDYFAFALNRERPVTSLVERRGCIAVSSIPPDRNSVVRGLGRNHRVEGIDWTGLPFSVRRSEESNIPVPEFAQRVRTVQIEHRRRLGSHTLFIGRVADDRRYADGPEFFVVHGLYQAWKNRYLGVAAGSRA
jgi:flavin reductase (DIM6/NTAB) family NADH-FMN oxidoreductase RutF